MESQVMPVKGICAASEQRTKGVDDEVKGEPVQMTNSAPEVKKNEVLKCVF